MTQLKKSAIPIKLFPKHCNSHCFKTKKLQLHLESSLSYDARITQPSEAYTRIYILASGCITSVQLSGNYVLLNILCCSTKHGHAIREIMWRPSFLTNTIIVLHNIFVNYYHIIIALSWQNSFKTVLCYSHFTTK